MKERFQLRSENENEESTDRREILFIKRELSDRSRQPLFERPEPWGLISVDDKRDHRSEVAHEWCKENHVIEGVLTILFNTMQNLPDNLLTMVVSEIILPEYLFVLCNHVCSSVRYNFYEKLFFYMNVLKFTLLTLRKHFTEILIL